MTLSPPELRVGLGPDVRAPLVERLAPLQPSKAELREARQIRRLVASLPDTGSIVIVHSPAIIGAYRDLIQDLRGPGVARSTRVVAAPSEQDEETVTQGLSLPIFIEPFVEAQRAHRRALAAAWKL